MSKESSTPIAPKGIVAKILAFLNLTDEGKIGNFFKRVINEFEFQIEAIETLIATAKLQYKSEYKDLSYKLEDAKANEEAVWYQIKPEDVSTRAQQDDFKDAYLQKIDEAAEETLKIEKQIKELEERHEAELKKHNADIAKIKAKVARIKE